MPKRGSKLDIASLRDFNEPDSLPASRNGRSMADGVDEENIVLFKHIT